MTRKQEEKIALMRSRMNPKVRLDDAVWEFKQALYKVKQSQEHTKKSYSLKESRKLMRSAKS